MLSYTLAREGKFYRGNLHSHSTVSDGGNSADDVINSYKAQGYNFLALTDHRIYGNHKGYETDDFIMIPGTELHTPNGRHHIVGIAEDVNNPGFEHLHNFNEIIEEKKMTAQDMIDLLTSHGNMAIYCHPYWSQVDFSEIIDLNNLTAMEIMNFGSEHYFKVGNSANHFDKFWWAEHPIWCVGSDDGHTIGFDTFGGYIRLKTNDFTYAGIIDAIKKGSFYACYSRSAQNNAPEIYDFVLEDGVAKITCSPCQDIYFHAVRENLPFHGTRENPVTHGEFEVPMTYNPFFVTACCEDFEGNTSWTQPIQLR